MPRASGGSTFGGDEFTERVLRWERQEIEFFRSITFEITADSTLPVYHAVSQASYPPIVAVFKVEAYGPDSSAVIDVTSLYTTNTPEFTAARGSFDDKRSFIERVNSPENVEVEATQTFTPENPPEMQRGSARSGAEHSRSLEHDPLVRVPMKPRLADKRVDSSKCDRPISELRNIGRSRAATSRDGSWKSFPTLRCPSRQADRLLRRSGHTGAMDTLDQKGIEDWQPAFESAGFRNAIVARDPPTASEDPLWSPEDIRNSLVRWLPSTIENADGPHVHDPRSGEILNGSVRIHHNVLNLARNWYFTQVAPLDPRAQRLPFPDSLMGRLVQYIVPTRSVTRRLAQHESQLISGRQCSECIVASADGDTRRRSWITYASTTSLSRKTSSTRGPDASHRPVRSFRDEMGIRSDSRRAYCRR